MKKLSHAVQYNYLYWIWDILMAMRFTLINCEEWRATRRDTKEPNFNNEYFHGTMTGMW